MSMLRRAASFLLLGLALFYLLEQYHGYQGRVLDCLQQSDINLAAEDFHTASGRAPTMAELAALRQTLLDEQMLVKEGIAQKLYLGDTVIQQRLLLDAQFLGLSGDIADKLQSVIAMGLHSSDEVVRRRLIQVQEHRSAAELKGLDPSEQTLIAIYSDKVLNMVPKQRFSFEQRFFSRDFDHAEDSALARSALALKALKAGQQNVDSDVFLGGEQFTGLSESLIQAMFGEQFFLALKENVPMTQWFGPLVSAYGWHLLYIHTIENLVNPSFTQMRANLELEWRQQRRQALWQEYLVELRTRYRVSCHVQN
jgi:hypothetical protein